MILFKNKLGFMSRGGLGAFVFCVALICGGGEVIGADSGEEESAPRVTSMRLNGNIFFSTTTAATYHLSYGTIGSITSGFTSNTFIISADITKDTPELRLRGVLRNTGERSELRLKNGAVVAGVVFRDTAPTHGRVHLHNVDTITLDGGTVNGNIDASRATADTTFNLMSGTITGNVGGGDEDDNFIIGAGFASSGRIDGRGGLDTLRLATGFTPTLANLFGGILTLTFSGGRLDLTLANIETIDIAGLTMVELPPIDMPLPPVDMPMVELPPVDMPMPSLVFTATAGDDVFAISNDITGSPERPLVSVIDGLGGQDELQLNNGAVVASVSFNTAPPTDGVVHLQNVEAITIDGGTVDGNIDASTATAGITFNLRTGAVGGNVIGSAHDDVFIISGDMVGDGPTLDINGVIRGLGGRDELRLITGGVVNDIQFSYITGSLSVEPVEIITIDGGRVNGSIDVGGAATNMTLNLISGTITGNVVGSAHDDVFIISGDMTGANPALAIGGVIDGRGGTGDTIELSDGAVVASIAFSDLAPSGGALHLQNVQFITLGGARVNGNIDTSAAVSPIIPLIFFLRAGSIFGDIIGSGFKDYFIISGDMTGANPELAINGVIDGGDGTHNTIVREDAIVLDGVGAVVTSIAFSDQAPTSGALHLQNIDAIGLYGGTVTGNIDASNAPAGVRFFLTSGSILGNVIGSAHNDDFYLESSITINGFIEGGAGIDRLHYTGAAVRYQLSGHGGLVADVTLSASQEDQRAIEEDELTVPILRVRNFEDLSLSPALNLYGAMSDALMQFGAQTAQGFQLADLNLATGRATQLMSQDSPFVQGKVWAHKITHAGNGKGSIGLNLTGLTARADSDYDYEMSLTQHGFDAPLATTKLGAFNLRAVSHTMTGVIETNVAEAQVSGYGAGVALLWNSGAAASTASASAHHHHGLSAHITSLASAYEVDATTSSLNPQAVVNEVSEGSFSAINAVVSAGLADKRELAYGLSLRTSADVSWQTLSLDDFTETGPDGIIINFDKATRLAARVGAGLEAEHWFSDVAFVHETSSGGTLSSGLSQNYRQDDGTAIEMKLGGKIADLATGLTLKAYVGMRTSLIGENSIDPSARFDLNWQF